MIAPPDAYADLLARDQWVNFNLEPRDGKLTKVPYTPSLDGDPQKARAGDLSTFRSCDLARDAHAAGRFDGVGFELLEEGDPYFFVDLDKQRDARTGAITNRARAILVLLDTLAEPSISGTGLHAYGRAAIPRDLLGEGRAGKKVGDFEIYFGGRFAAMTFDPLPGYEQIRDVDEATIRLVWRLLFPDEPKTERPAPPPPPRAAHLDDAATLDKAFASKGGEDFRRQHDGAYLQDDKSADDYGYLARLYFWFQGDQHRMRRAAEASGRRRDKWFTRRGETDWLGYSIAHICEAGGPVYDPAIAHHDTAPPPPGGDAGDADLLAAYLAMPHDDLAHLAVGLHQAATAEQAAKAEECRLRHGAQGMLSNVMQIRRNKAIKTEGPTLTAAIIAYDAAPKDDEGYARMPLAGIADAVGKGVDAVSAHLARGQEWGLLDKKLVTDRYVDPDTGEITLKPTTRVKLLATAPRALETLIVIDPPRPLNKKTGKARLTWGGEREPCPSCGSSRKTVRTFCSDCGELLGTAQPAAPVSRKMPDTDRAESWASILGVESPGDPPAPVSGILPPLSVNERVAAPCIRQDAAYRKTTTPAPWDGTHPCADCGKTCYAQAGAIPRCLPCSRGQPAESYGHAVAAAGGGG